MALSCNKILDLPYANQLKFIAGKKGASNSIRWVHYLEDPAYVKWLKGGELIIISGSVIQDNTEKLIRLMNSLYEYHIAGIIINLSPYIREIPQSVIREADELELPLFEMAAQIRIVDISQSICYALFQSQQVEQQNANAIREIIYGQRITERRMEHLRSIGISNDKSYRMIALKATPFSEELPQQSKLYDAGDIYSLIQDMEGLLHRYYQENFHQLFYMPDDGLLLLLLSDMDYSSVRKGLEEVYALLQKGIKGKVTILIGSRFDQVREIKSAYEITRNLLLSSEEEGIVDYSDDILAQLFHHYPDREELFQNVSYTLGGLLEDDKGELFETLCSFFNCDRNVKKTAENLYVHVNTIHYRLSRIEKLLDISLEDGKKLFQLELCCSLYRLYQTTK